MGKDGESGRLRCARAVLHFFSLDKGIHVAKSAGCGIVFLKFVHSLGDSVGNRYPLCNLMRNLDERRMLVRVGTFHRQGFRLLSKIATISTSERASIACENFHQLHNHNDRIPIDLWEHSAFRGLHDPKCMRSRDAKIRDRKHYATGRCGDDEIPEVGSYALPIGRDLIDDRERTVARR